MLTLMQYNANVPPYPFPSLAALLAESFPRTPQEMLQLEQRLSIAAAQTADQIVLAPLTRAHEVRLLMLRSAVYDGCSMKSGHGPAAKLQCIIVRKGRPDAAPQDQLQWPRRRGDN